MGEQTIRAKIASKEIAKAEFTYSMKEEKNGWEWRRHCGKRWWDTVSV
jgi:hypothetical protein